VRLVPAGDKGEAKPRFARVKLPPSVPRLIPVGSGFQFVLLEDLVSAHILSLFPLRKVLECQPFRITRDADIEIEEDEADDLLSSVEQQLRQRRFGFGVRLEVAEAMSSSMLELLGRSLELVAHDIYSVAGPLNIPDLSALCKLDLPELKDKPFEPHIPQILRQSDSIYDAISQGDILLHQPYDSFGSVVEFIRAGPNSPIVDALIDAAERGKQVAVLVELKARFDEENNILWARRLEQTGAHVVYGVLGLKTHAKIALVIRQEGTTLRRYVHMGTGNYNPVTARQYTDFGLMTANYLTGYSGQHCYRKLVVAPVNLRDRFVELIRREVEHHRSGRLAGIIAKMNAITDTVLIEEFYAASRSGVPIDLLVRGVCCLRPGVKGQSETIRVGSIVGRFLEHSRVYRFLNGGHEEIYLSSADLMSRNLDRRVEIMFPIEEPEIKARIRRDALELPFSDTVKMRWLRCDGSYARCVYENQVPFDSQQSLIP
jgi:polyphosphate kinase